MTTTTRVSTLYKISNWGWIAVFKDEVSTELMNITKTVSGRDVRIRWLLDVPTTSALEEMAEFMGEEYRVIELSTSEYVDLMDRKDPTIYKILNYSQPPKVVF